MNKLDVFREKYPQYNEVPDEVLADGIYKKFYSNISRERFDEAIFKTIEPEPTVEPDLTQPTEPDPEDQSFLRSVADVPLSFGRGVVSGIKFISDALGADNEFSQAAEGVEEYLASLMSAQSKQDSAEISRIMKDAEDKGVGDQVVAALKAFTVAPIDLVTNALGTAAPGIVAAVGSTVAGAPAAATIGVLGAVGTTQGLGIVKDTIYDGTKQALLDAGATEQQAEERARLAQEYGGQNLDLILGGGAFGGLAAITGVDKALAGPIAKKILGDSLIKSGSKGGLKDYASAILKEAGPEGAQAAQEQLSENIALQREGFDVPTFRGVAGATTLEGIVAGALATGVEFATPKEDTEADTLDEESQRTQQRLEEAQKKDDAATKPDEPDSERAKPSVPSADVTKTDEGTEKVGEPVGRGVGPAGVAPDKPGDTEGRVDDTVKVAPEAEEKDLADEPFKYTTTMEYKGREVDTTASINNVDNIFSEEGYKGARRVLGTLQREKAKIQESLDYGEKFHKEQAQKRGVTLEEYLAPKQRRLSIANAKILKIQEQLRGVEEKDIILNPERDGPTFIDVSPKQERSDPFVYELIDAEPLKKIFPRVFGEEKTKVGVTVADVNNFKEVFKKYLSEVEPLQNNKVPIKLRDAIIKNTMLQERLESVGRIKAPQVSELRKQSLRASKKLESVYQDTYKEKRPDAFSDTRKEYQEAVKAISELGRVYRAAIGDDPTNIITTDNKAQIELSESFPNLIKEDNLTPKQKLQRQINNTKKVLSQAKQRLRFRGGAGSKQVVADLEAKLARLEEQQKQPTAQTTEVKEDATKDPETIKEAKTVAENTKNLKEEDSFEDLSIENSQAPNADQTTPNNVGNINQNARPKWKQVIGKYTPKALMQMAGAARAKLFRIYTLRMLNDTNNLLGGSKMVQYLQALKISEANVADRNSIINEAAVIMRDIQNFRKEKTNGRDNNNILKDLGIIMNSATMRQKDPMSLPKDDELRKAYEKLPPKAKNIYGKLRAFYQKQTDGFVFDLVEKYQRVMVDNPDDPSYAQKRRMKIAEALIQFGSEEQIKKTYFDKTNEETVNYVDEYIKEREKAYKNLEDTRLKSAASLSQQDLADLDATIKGTRRSLDKLKKKQSRRITPYFPLKRFGEYWFQVKQAGKKQPVEFYTFESAADRDAALETRLKELQEAGDPDLSINARFNKKGEIESIDDNVPDAGNRLLTGMSSFDVSSRLGENLKDVVNGILENRKKQFQEAGLTDNDIKDIENEKKKVQGMDINKMSEEINDAITQLTFMTLPENNIRKAFLQRRNIVGAGTDVARIFSGQAISFAYQRSRLKYTDSFFTQIDNAYIAAKQDRNVDRSALKIDLVRELDARATHILGIKPTTTADNISNGLTQFTFLWLLTAPASGLINIAGMAAIGMPYIGARFGFGKTNKLMMQYSTKYLTSRWFSSSKQAKDAQGNTVNVQYSTTAPTLEKKIDELDVDPKLQPVLKTAYKRFMHDNDVNASLTHDFTGAGREQDVPGVARGIVGGYRTSVDFISAFFHHTERFQREIMLMTSFQLAYEKNVKDGKKDAFEDAIQQAKDLTGMSIGDFTSAGKPPVLAQPFVKNIFQFKQYSLIQTYNMIRNAYVMTAFKDGDDPQLKAEKAEARKRLVGMLGITFLMAGAAGLPIYTFSMLAIEVFSAAFDDEEDRIEDGEAYVNGLLSQTIGGKGAAMLLRGVPGELANIGISERVSLDLANLWMRDSGLQLNYEDAYKATLINLLGPTVSIGANFAKAANLYMNEYNPRAAFEAAAPILAANISKAERYLADKAAVSLTKGTEIQGDLDAVDVLYRALGFAPENVLRKQKSAIRMKAGELKITGLRTRLLGALFLATHFDDDNMYDDVKEKIDRFNDKYPEFRIRGRDIRNSLRRRTDALRERERSNGVTINRKLRRRLEEDYPAFYTDEDE
jgi:hypothetical protein